MSFVGVCQILCVSFFPFGIEGRTWVVIVLIPDQCLSIYFVQMMSLTFGLFTEVSDSGPLGSFI